MEQVTLNVIRRTSSSKKERNQLKRKGLIPAIFYGKHIEENIPIAVDPIIIKKILKSQSSSSFINLEIEQNGEKFTHLALIKDVQKHPVYRMPIHVDFYAIEEKDEIEVEVPVTVKGVSVGVKKGGILQLIRKEITVKCLPKNLPEKIEIDITNLDINDNVHIEDLEIPNVKFLYDTNFTILTIASPAKEKVEVEEEVEEEEEQE
jgi:large subunit ribosomal protein L25